MAKTFKKKLNQRMKVWERGIFTYGFKDEEVHHCLNCFHDFTGNYCPYCSQAAGTKRITWKSILENFLELWDFTTRSVPSTLWQLTYRPGHLIRDYLRGRRLAAFPPIKMMLVVALFTGIIDHMCDRFIVEDENEEPTKTEVQSTAGKTKTEANDTSKTEEDREKEERLLEKFDKYQDWSDENPGWAMLIFCSFLILPTWLVFRHAPRLPRHTMPEGFYIQVFMSQPLLIFSLLTYVHNATAVLVPLYYLYTYHRLFGYKIWGSIWRIVLAFALATIEFFFVLISIMLIFYRIDSFLQ